MDISEIAKKLGFSDSKLLIRKAAELRRLCDVHFDSSIIGVGEVAKAIICMEIAATRLGVLFDRSAAVKLSGMSERAYITSYNSLHNGIGVKLKLDVRELAIQFGCVRIIPYVRDGLKLYKDRFLSSLPAARRASADFTRPVFMAAAFYLCAKKHKLKVDKIKLIELCGTSESEFSSVSTTMKDLCHDVFGVAKEKKDPKEVKTNRDLLDVLPSKRKAEDGGYLSDDGAEERNWPPKVKVESKEKLSKKKVSAHRQRIGMDLNTPIRSNTTPLSSSVFKSKLIFLHEWWLMKPQNQCKGLAVAGIASMERERMFFSSVIVKRHEPNVVETEDGITIIFRGFINSSRTSQNGFPSNVCRHFSVGFPHNWKNYSAHSSGNECQYVDRVTGFNDSNASSHKKTADVTSHEAMEADGKYNIASPRLSQPLVDVVYNGENRVSDVDDLNASCHKKTADVSSQEAEDNNNIGGLRLSQPQVDLINNGENGVSIAAAAESNQSLMGVFEFDPIHEQNNVRSPLYPKKLEFGSDLEEKKRIKKKIVEDNCSLCSRVLTRSIAKKSGMMLKRDGRAEVKRCSCPVRRSPRLHNYKNK